MDECDKIAIKDIMYKHHLISHTMHAAHELIDSLLIYAPALGATKREGDHQTAQRV